MIENMGMKALQAMADEIRARYVEKTDVAEYSIQKKATATNGYAASYQLMKGDSPVGDTINIPKDYLVRSAVLKVAAAANSPEEGYAVGDKYIDFTINTSDKDGTESHIYLKVSDLVDTYTSGSGISISSQNVVSVKINSNAANGLNASSSGLGLNLATESSPGAMSAEDKKKLNAALQASDFKEITEADVKAIFQ